MTDDWSTAWVNGSTSNWLTTDTTVSGGVLYVTGNEAPKPKAKKKAATPLTWLDDRLEGVMSRGREVLEAA